MSSFYFRSLGSASLGLVLALSVVSCRGFQTIPTLSGGIYEYTITDVFEDASKETVSFEVGRDILPPVKTREYAQAAILVFLERWNVPRLQTLKGKIFKSNNGAPGDALNDVLLEYASEIEAEVMADRDDETIDSIARTLIQEAGGGISSPSSELRYHHFNEEVGQNMWRLWGSFRSDLTDYFRSPARNFLPIEEFLLRRVNDLGGGGYSLGSRDDYRYLKVFEEKRAFMLLREGKPKLWVRFSWNPTYAGKDGKVEFTVTTQP